MNRFVLNCYPRRSTRPARKPTFAEEKFFNLSFTHIHSSLLFVHSRVLYEFQSKDFSVAVHFGTNFLIFHFCIWNFSWLLKFCFDSALWSRWLSSAVIVPKSSLTCWKQLFLSRWLGISTHWINGFVFQLKLWNIIHEKTNAIAVWVNQKYTKIHSYSYLCK